VWRGPSRRVGGVFTAARNGRSSHAADIRPSFVRPPCRRGGAAFSKTGRDVVTHHDE
jgi:hypothetical protein